MRRNCLSVFGAMTIALVASAQPSTAGTDEAITSIPVAQLDWTRTDEGVAFASLVGDRFVEPYMAMVQLPAGLVSPAHVKTANMFGVVVSGTMTHIAVGAEPSSEILLPEGSFYKVPAGLAHVSRCVSETDCITFLYQDGEFDFLPITQ